MLRKASAHWQGSTKDGSGTLSTQSGTLRETPYSFKARFGVSRKFAIPLLEWLDRERVTRRVGDARVIL